MIAIDKTTDIGFRIQVVCISPLYLGLEIKQAFRRSYHRICIKVKLFS